MAERVMSLDELQTLEQQLTKAVTENNVSTEEITENLDQMMDNNAAFIWACLVNVTCDANTRFKKHDNAYLSARDMQEMAKFARHLMPKTVNATRDKVNKAFGGKP
jgi:hypothetical protein